MRAPRLLRPLLLAASVLLPLSASALPVTYTFNSGSVTVTATVGGGLVAGPVSQSLTGVAVTVDEGALTLNSINFTIGSTGSIAIAPPYLGFTSINIDFASLTAINGTLTPVDPGPPAEYSYSISNVSVSGQFDAVNLIPANSITDAPFGFVNPSASGTIFVDPGSGTLDMDGITLGVIDPDGPGGVDPLVLKADFFFSGMEVPEPAAASLVGVGALALWSVLRRRVAR